MAFGVLVGSMLSLGTYLLSDYYSPPDKIKLSKVDDEYQTVLCGPTAATIALGRIGVVASPEPIADRCDVTLQGVASGQLAGAVRQLFDGAASVRIGCIHWGELKGHNGSAVLHINDDHYIAVDPREVSSQPQVEPSVRVYQPGRPAQWWSRAKLEGIWKGHAITFERKSPERPPSAPTVRWDECYIDKGIVISDSRVSHRFSFRNIGTKELRIRNVDLSCGCLSYSLSQQNVPPNGEGYVEISTHIRNDEGFNHLFAIVDTDDPQCRMTTLSLVVSQMKERWVFPSVIYCGELARGSRISKTFYVTNPGFGEFSIRKVECCGTPRAIQAPLNDSVSYRKLGDDAIQHSITTGMQLNPDDYVGTIVLTKPEIAPLGAFANEVQVELATEDGEPTNSVIRLEGVVVQPVQALPRRLFVSLDSHGVGEASFRVVSLVERRFDVERYWTDSPDLIEVIKREQRTGLADAYVAKIRSTNPRSESTPSKHSIFFALENGTQLEIPVTVVIPEPES